MLPTLALAGLILALAACDARAQEALQALRSYGVEEIEAPPRENPWKAEEWRKKYGAEWPIHVAVENRELVLSRWTGSERPRFGRSYRASGIEYVGTNRGEFGGGLLAVFADGRRTKLLDENIVALVPRGSALLVVSGLAHGDVIAGALHRIDDAHAKPRVRRLTLLPDTPFVVLEHGQVVRTRYFQQKAADRLRR